MDLTIFHCLVSTRVCRLWFFVMDGWQVPYWMRGHLLPLPLGVWQLCDNYNTMLWRHCSVFGHDNQGFNYVHKCNVDIGDPWYYNNSRPL